MNRAMMGLFTVTQVHPGIGSSVDVIDLPIQREAHTGWPCVFGSALRGAMRSKAEERWKNDKPLVYAVFGPPPPTPGATGAPKPSDFAGALAVSDAKLLLLPMRSLTTHFRWVCCPAILTRFKRDALRLGTAVTFDSVNVADDAALVAHQETGKPLYIEELRFTTRHHKPLAEIAKAIAMLVPASEREGFIKALSNQLTVISDDRFAMLCRTATPTTAHIRLNENKTVEPGALWYEETLPPDTLLYADVAASASRYKDKPLEGHEVLRTAIESLFEPDPYLQVGGNETVGMGWCQITAVRGAKAGAVV